MPDDGFIRALDAIDTDLSDCVRLNNATRHELTQTRSSIIEMQAHELSLIAAMDARQRRVDRLLDQRLAAMLAEELVSQ